MTNERICAYCHQPMQGVASAGNEWLCHPNDGLDYYRLVTIHRMPLPDGRVWEHNHWQIE